MRHVVFGTAGHIDHGKTSLVKALTGTDCDRLPEERERGITIDLGFAQLTEGDLQLHFVDVPGHERLVHTMIAGAAGIDRALLVVAADESVMPQTREHLEVIRLMGVPGLVVAITKIDQVDPDLIDLVVEEVREYLEPTPYASATVVSVSARSGVGLDRLKDVLLSEAAAAVPHDIEDRPFRQAVDRVFSLTGAGTVITGSSLWGRLGVGQEVTILPIGETARVRRLHVHGVERERVEAGERVAVNLVGVDRDRLRRGHQLLEPGPWRVTRMVTVSLELLATAPGPLDENDELEVHALAARVAARVERLAERPLAPGSATVAQLKLREQMLLFPGDRLVLRRPSPVNTFAGGRVLDAHLARWRRRDSSGLGQLPAVHRDGWPQLLASWIEAAGLAAVTAEELAGRLGVLTSAVEAPLGRLIDEGSIRTLATRPPRLVSSRRVDEVTVAAARELERRFAAEEVSAGIPARDFAAAVLPRSALPLADIYLDEMRRRGVFDVAQGRVVPTGSDAHMTAAGEELAARVESLYHEAGLDPPSPGKAAETLRARPAMVEGICQFLVQRGRLVRLEGKLLLHRGALDGVARSVRSLEGETFSVGEFKDRFGLTRKLAIPILEWLDSERVTDPRSFCWRRIGAVGALRRGFEPRRFEGRQLDLDPGVVHHPACDWLAVTRCGIESPAVQVRREPKVEAGAQVKWNETVTASVGSHVNQGAHQHVCRTARHLEFETPRGGHGGQVRGWREGEVDQVPGWRHRRRRDRRRRRSRVGGFEGFVGQNALLHSALDRDLDHGPRRLRRRADARRLEPGRLKLVDQRRGEAGER
jgi:selenocysteine-specific elongation factor